MITITYREEQGIRIELRAYNDRDNTILYRRVDADGKALSGYEPFTEAGLLNRVYRWLNPTQGSLKGSIKI
jgi:hypothetical protein